MSAGSAGLKKEFPSSSSNPVRAEGKEERKVCITCVFIMQTEDSGEEDLQDSKQEQGTSGEKMNMRLARSR